MTREPGRCKRGQFRAPRVELRLYRLSSGRHNWTPFALQAATGFLDLKMTVSM
jgi:hypothetical protein